MNFFNYFFRSIPEKNNFILFGKTHMSILIIAFIVSYLIIKNMKVNKNFELLVGSVLLIQQVSLYYWYYNFQLSNIIITWFLISIILYI